VIITHPDEIREVFMAPPDVLHPGEGARVLEPLVGKNSVIPLDEAAHMEQRRLLLPAFHGERMAALSGLMTEVAEREVASWPRDGEISLSRGCRGSPWRSSCARYSGSTPARG
jgi:cytochrome P450